MSEIFEFLRRASDRAGLPPGSLIGAPDDQREPAEVDVFVYNERRFIEKNVRDAGELKELLSEDGVLWVNVNGAHDARVLEWIGGLFGIHPLVLEDVMNTSQRPKCDDLESYAFAVVKMIGWDESGGRTDSEQVSLILGGKYVISFQERRGDVFDRIRDRIRHGKGRVRTMNADYLAYCLLDAVVDGYFGVLENVGEKIEELENKIVTQPDNADAAKIHALKRELIYLRRAVWPLREVIGRLTRGETRTVRKDVRIYYRDLYDHTIQAIDTLESFRDMVLGLLDTYLSSMSNRMNEIMKVLTIIATIFIPLTFIVGVYGMNFKYMPELEYELAYPAVWAVMIVATLGMLLFFRRKKWL